MPPPTNQLHFVLFPLMAQGHMIPMVDIAKLLARHGVIVTIVTTPRNAARFTSVLARAIGSGLKINVIEVEFPTENSRLPQGCENVDMLPSLDLLINLLTTADKLEERVNRLFEEFSPKPSCIISDMCLPYTANIAIRHKIPRISFIGFSCFCLMCTYKTLGSNLLDSVNSETEYFVPPGLPDHIEVTKAQLPLPGKNMEEFDSKIADAEKYAYGTAVNSFEELEPAYVREYKKLKSDKVWCIGPVSLCNTDNLDKVERGNKASTDENECLKWLDSRDIASVLYVCFGSLCNLILPQLVELGLALEELNRPFIWVLRGGEKSVELEKWILSSGLEERIIGKGLIIRGWAPQVLILSHPAIGGFLTHCGWNSMLEATSAGVPMVTWPLFADQFCNEKLVVQVLKIAVSIGVEVPLTWGEEEQIGVLVKKQDIIEAVEHLMKEGEEQEKRRGRAKKLAEMAIKAVEEGGSSYVNIDMLIHDIAQQVHSKICT